MKHTVVLLLSILSLFSCQKDHLAGKFLLSDEMKNQNPYSGGEKLYFESSSGEKFIWKSKGRSNEIYETPVGINSLDYYLIEVDKTSIEFEGNREYFSFYLEMAGQVNNVPRYLISFVFEKKGMQCYLDLPLSKENTPYVDSLEIYGKWYTNVYIYEEEKLDNRAYKLYYSTELGIIKIDFSDGLFWELAKIE